VHPFLGPVPAPDPLQPGERWRIEALVTAYGSEEVQRLLDRWGECAQRIENADVVIRMADESRDPSPELDQDARRVRDYADLMPSVDGFGVGTVRPRIVTRRGYAPGMNTTDWLIIATAAGPIVATLVAPGFIGAVLKLAKARAQRVQHVPASGTDLYHNGVPLTETQFRKVFAAYQAELDELPPPPDRTDWEMKRQFAAAQRLAVLTGTHPHAFPNVGDAD
jgi:hypothetical protein